MPLGYGGLPASSHLPAQEAHVARPGWGLGTAQVVRLVDDSAMRRRSHPVTGTRLGVLRTIEALRESSGQEGRPNRLLDGLSASAA